MDDQEVGDVSNLDIAPQEEQITQENTTQKPLTQEQLNKIIVREKRKAAESARRELEAKYQQEIEQLKQSRSQNDNKYQVDDIVQEVKTRIDQEKHRLKEELEEEQLREKMKEVAKNYYSKMDEAKSFYEDFDQVVEDFDPQSYSDVVYLVSHLDNAGHIIYDLSKNPQKLGSIVSLIQRNPRQAEKALKKLSDSIDINTKSMEQYDDMKTNDPLDSLTVKRVAGDNNVKQISDLRKMPWLRG